MQGGQGGAPPAAARGARRTGAGRRRGRRRTERAPAGLRQRRGRVEGLQSRHGGDRRLPRRRGHERRSHPDPALEMHESEASFQAVVDPYARADFFISFGEEGVELEEGFVTFHGAARRAADEGRQDARGVRQGEHAAQSRAALDRPAARHQQPGRRRRRDRRRRHLGGAADSEPVAVPRSDRPGVPRRFGGDVVPRERARRPELRRAPARLSATSAKSPTSISARRPRTATTRPASSTTSTSGASRPTSSASTRPPVAAAAALDLPLVHRPHRVDLEPARAADRPSGRDRASTSRATISSPAAGSPASATTGRSAPTTRRCSTRADRSLLTYWPSEFSQVRGQYRRTNYAEGPTANEFLFQFQFSIGAHGAHPF